MHRFAVLALFATAACGATTTPATTGTEDAAVSTDTLATDTVTPADTTGSDASTGDVGKDISKDVATPSCASRAGAYTVEGTCSGGGASITFACMQAKECELSWISGYRAWTGPLTGNHYELANKSGSEKIIGDFHTADSASYQFSGGSLTCDATMTRLDPTQADSLCCDVKAQDCKSGFACAFTAEKPGAEVIYTTGCLPLADSPTAEGGACTQSATASPCQAGLICIRNPGSQGGDGTCVKACIGDNDCAGATRCAVVTDEPRGGICQTPCIPFANGACASGYTCRVNSFADANYDRYLSGECGINGTLTTGAACTSSTDCGEGLICTKDGCKAQCDGAHKCATGTCTDFGLPLGKGVGAGFGFCK